MVFNFQPPYIEKGCVAKCTKDLQCRHFTHLKQIGNPKLLNLHSNLVLSTEFKT